jgi:type VI secretion system secreted protein Hcp
MRDSTTLLRRPLVAGLITAAVLSGGAAVATGAGTSDRPNARAAQGAPTTTAECQAPASARPGGPAAAFLALDGIDGDSTDARHRGAIEVHGLRLGGERPSIAARPRPRLLVISKSLDSASPRLLQALNDGRHIANATVELAAGPQQTYTFADLAVVDYEHQATRGRNDERVCLSFRRVESSFRPRNPDGSLGGAIAGGLGG